MDRVRPEALRVSSYFLELTPSELEWVRRNTDVWRKDRGAVILSEGGESPGLVVGVFHGGGGIAQSPPAGVVRQGDTIDALDAV